MDLEDLCLIAGFDEPRDTLDPMAHKYLERVLYSKGLSFRQRTDNAAKRGTAIHTVLEHWIDFGEIPNINAMPRAWQGYARSLCGFLLTERPSFLESEMIVGSAEHGIAGARDTVLRLKHNRRGHALVDLKTSKACYPSSHFRQLTAYDRLGVCCGQDPTDSQGILLVYPDGKPGEIVWLQDFGQSEFFWRAFLNALRAARDERWINDRLKAQEKERKAAAK